MSDSGLDETGHGRRGHGAGRWPHRENGSGLQRYGRPAPARVRANGPGKRAQGPPRAESWRGPTYRPHRPLAGSDSPGIGRSPLQIDPGLGLWQGRWKKSGRALSARETALPGVGKATEMPQTDGSASWAAGMGRNGARCCSLPTTKVSLVRVRGEVSFTPYFYHSGMVEIGTKRPPSSPPPLLFRRNEASRIKSVRLLP